MPRFTTTTLLLATLGCQAVPPERFNDLPVGTLGDAEAFCSSLGEARCAWWERCLPARAQALAADGGCAAAAAADCRRENAASTASVARKRMALRSNAASSCVEGWRTRACTEEEPGSCADVFIGAVTQWLPCASDGECAPGLFCGRAGPSCGLCLARGRPEEPCREHRECDVGLRCVSGACTRASDENASCAADALLCDDGLTCVSGRCARVLPTETPAAEGESCAADPCADDGTWLWCNPATTTCARLPRAGEACTDACSDARCVDGTCVADPLPGDRCDAGCGAMECQGGTCGVPACDDGGTGVRAGRVETRDGGVDGGAP